MEKFKQLVKEANKAFESTLKSILIKLKIPFDENGTAKDLLKIFYEKDIIYPHMESFTNNVVEILKGLPTLRNKQGGHGQGLTPQKLNESYAELSLYLSASFIVFLIKRYKEIKT